MPRFTAAAGVPLLLVALLLLPFAACALPPEFRSDEDLSFRLMIGTLDGSENRSLLHNDAHRFTLGLSFSQPLDRQKRLAANLELWVNERGYGAATTAAGVPTDAITFQAATLVYGLRMQSNTALQPYGLAAIGFQASRLRTVTLTTPVTAVQEDTLVPAAHLGAGIEWRVGNDLFSLDWRHWYAKGDFSKFGVRALDLGGNYFGIGLGHHW